MHPGRIGAAVVLSLAQIACSNSQEKAREKLGQMNIKYNDDTFVERAKDGDVIVVGLFVAAGMSPTVVNKEGKTALLAAAEGGRLPVVELLLEKGADVNARDKKFGATPRSGRRPADTPSS
jgi:ankyrin repeat protein